MRAKSRAHLVAVVEADGPAPGLRLQEMQQLLQRLVRAQDPLGEYATTIMGIGQPELYLAFAEESDARKLAASVRAVPTDN